MKHLTLSFVIPLLFAATATAAPAPTLMVIEVDRARVGDLLAPELPASADDPGGLVVPGDADPSWFAIGLRAGDVIRYIDSLPATSHIMLRDGVNILEIDRHGRAIIMRVLVHGPAVVTKQLTGTEFEDVVARLANPEPHSTVVRRGNAVSGVRMTDSLLELQVELETGDIVHSIGGKPIRSDAALVTALQNLKVGATIIKLQRHGRPVTLELTRDASIDLSTIKRLSATSYEIPRAVMDAAQHDLFFALRKIETVKVVGKSATRGIRIYNVQPGAPAAAVGLQNDDIILDVGGNPVASFSEAAKAYRLIAGEPQVTVHIERKGKPVTLSYAIK